jgi:hypothetical protein
MVTTVKVPLESRSQFIHRISVIKGATEKERTRRIPQLLQQLRLDIKDILTCNKEKIDDMRSLLKRVSPAIRGSVKTMNELELSAVASLEALDKSLNDLLLLTYQKKNAVWTESTFFGSQDRESAALNEANKIFQTNIDVTKLDHETRRNIEKLENPKSPLDKVVDVINRHEDEAANDSVVTPDKLSTSKKRLQRGGGAKDRDTSKQIVIIAKSTLFSHMDDVHGIVGAKVVLQNKSVLELPKPIAHKVSYSMEELAAYLEPYVKQGMKQQGLKRIIGDLRMNGRVCFGSTSFMRFRKQWDGKVPEDLTLWPGRGRPKAMSVQEILDLNSKQMSSLTLTSDCGNDARKGLKDSKKRKADELGLVGDPLYEPHAATVRDYMGASLLLDPDIAEIDRSSTRATSINREVMANSARTCLCNIAAHIIMQFIPGHWKDKPKELPIGVQEAYDIACDVYEQPVRPIDEEDLFNFDACGRFGFEGVHVPAPKNQSRKINKKSLTRNVRKFSSAARRGDHDDTIGEGMKFKMMVLTGLKGVLSPICLWYYGLSDSQLSVPFKVIRIPGLAIGSDMDPNCQKIGYIILSRGTQAESATEGTASISEQVLKWFHENIAIPFMKEVMRGKKASSNAPDIANFVLDSDIPYLNYLNRPEIAAMHQENKIQVMKVGAASTHCYQYNDLAQCFMLAGNEFQKTTLKGHMTNLKRTVITAFDQCEELLVRGIKKAHMVDTISVAPMVYQNAFSPKKIQDGYIVGGAAVKLTNGKVLAAVNIRQMIHQCKASTGWSKEFLSLFYSKIKGSCLEFLRRGNNSEEFLTFPQMMPGDKDAEGNDASRNPSLNQLHLLRNIFLHHEYLRRHVLDKIDAMTRKQQERTEHKYALARAHLSMNKEVENKLHEKCKDENQQPLALDAIEAKVYSKLLRKDQLLSFCLVRMQENLLDPIPKELEKLLKPALASKAFQVSAASVCANDPGGVPMVTYTAAFIPDPVISGDNSATVAIELDKPFIQLCFQNFATLKLKGDDHENLVSNDTHMLNPEILSHILKARLHRNLEERNVPNKNHAVWQFVLNNMNLGAIILKLHDVVLSDAQIKRKAFKDHLLSMEYQRTLPYVTTEYEKLLGCYLYDHPQGDGVIRAGSAAIGIGKRGKEHVNASKQKSEQEARSRFYSTYPHRESKLYDEHKCKGHFEELKQVLGIAFDSNLIIQVQDMFHWDTGVLGMLGRANVRGASTLIEKKHRLVCYFFEKMFDLVLGGHSISSNPGFETFIGKWDGGHGDEED